MRLPLPRLRLPLLWKELLEQAARRRTYIIRTVYAGLLFLFFLIVSNDFFTDRAQSPASLLGTGRHIFEALMYLQFTGIYIFLPGMMAGVITAEKERDSLALLLLTEMKPFEILMQKYFGRLVPMFAFLLLGLPLMGIAYAFGGITGTYILSGIYLLTLTMFNVGAYALMMSAFCRSTSSAFVGSYLITGLITFFLPLMWVMGQIVGIRGGGDEDVMLGLFLPYLFDDAGRKGFGEVLLRSIPVVVLTIISLRLGFKFLTKRAFAMARNPLLILLNHLDKAINKANEVVGGIMIIKPRDDQLLNDPVAWRESTKRSLGNLRYRLRIFLMIEGPLAILGAGMITLGNDYGGQSETFTALATLLWFFIILCVIVTVSNSIGKERSQQTLEVLLTTPVRGVDIIKQKMKSVRGLMFVLGIPMLTIFILEAWYEHGGGNYRYHDDLGWFGYIIASMLSLIVYFPLLSWFAMWVSLKTRTRGRALMMSLGGMVLWLVVPWIVVAVVDAVDYVSSSDYIGFTIFSPATIPGMVEIDEFPSRNSPIFWVPINYIFYGLLALMFRWFCLRRADELLGRVAEE